MGGNNGNIATAISDDGEDLGGLDLGIKYVRLMLVSQMNPPGGLVAAPAVAAPAAAAPMGLADPATVAAIGANHGVAGRDQATQRCQANIAAGNIGDPQVVPTGIHGRNPDHVTLLAQMNQEVARGIANLNSFLPSADK